MLCTIRQFSGQQYINIYHLVYIRFHACYWLKIVEKKKVRMVIKD